MGRQIDRWMIKQTNGTTRCPIHKQNQMDRWMDRQMDRQIDRLIDRKIDRQIDIYIYLDR